MPDEAAVPESPEVPPPEVQARPQVVAERLRQVRSEISERFIEMGQLLLEAYRGNYARTLGFPTFEAFVETTLEMSYRKARYLAECVDVFIDQYHVAPSELAQLGWTRAKELIPAIAEDTPAPDRPAGETRTKEENVRDWMSYAQNHTTNEINLAVRRAQAPPGQAEHLHGYDTITVGVFHDEKDVIDGAINLAMLEAATERRGRALMLICQDYAAEAAARQLEAQGAGVSTSEDVPAAPATAATD